MLFKLWLPEVTCRSLHGPLLSQVPCEFRQHNPDAAASTLWSEALSVYFLISAEAGNRCTPVFSFQNRVLVPEKFVPLNYSICLAMIIISKCCNHI